ncbi:MAG: HEAT repeat domain-containing protein, partial [Treponema sp.]|nr:HEAT repeat domain-containing protein [Treponema sp.]
IVAALGETGSAEAVPFLTEMAQNSDERAVLRMAALDSIAKLGYEDGLTAVIAAVSAQDPNVRSSAIAALGPFSSTDADKAILDGFRDSYYRTRIGAAQAAGRRRLEMAVPYLRQRAENDEVPAAREEAIKALGAIGNGEAIEILDSFFMDKKSSDRIRVLSAEMLLKNDPSSYAPKIIGALDEAKASNQTNLYNGFLRILSPANAASLENLAARYLYSGTVIEKSYALDMILNNGFKSQADNIRPLLDEKKYNQSIVRKARTVLEKLGIPVEEKKEENAEENLKQETDSQAFPEASG